MAVVVRGSCIEGEWRFVGVKVVTKPLFSAFLAFFTIFHVFTEKINYSKDLLLNLQLPNAKILSMTLFYCKSQPPPYD